jgi:hypothetical protein
MSPTRGVAAAAVLAGVCWACSPAPEPLPPVANEPRCPPPPVDNYLDERWQQCWFDAARGRWRTLSHDFHYNVLIVEVEAASLDDSEEIIRRFIDLHRERFIDITLYVHQEPAAQPGPVRRLHWDLDSNAIDRLDFTGARGQ